MSALHQHSLGAIIPTYPPGIDSPSVPNASFPTRFLSYVSFYPNPMLQPALNNQKSSKLERARRESQVSFALISSHLIAPCLCLDAQPATWIGPINFAFLSETKTRDFFCSEWRIYSFCDVDTRIYNRSFNSSLKMLPPTMSEYIVNSLCSTLRCCPYSLKGRTWKISFRIKPLPRKS